MLPLILIIFLMIAGLYILVKGADYLVDGSSDVARWLKVSPILVGLTIVAFGTSLPEFIVSLFSVLNGSADISIGNIIGSNIANITLVLGICAIMTTLFVKSRTLLFEFPFLVGSTLLMVIFGSKYFNGDGFSFNRIEGFILIIIFLGFLYYIYHSMKKDKKKSVKNEFKHIKHDNSLTKNISLIVGGITALVIGGRLFIYSASEIATNMGINEAFIGLTMAALGTSLPELVTSGIAAWKKQGDLAIGNIVGSNIFNILFVLGTVSLIKPITASSSLLNIDSMIMIGITLLFTLFAVTTKKLVRWEGISLVIMYIIYVVFLFFRL